MKHFFKFLENLQPFQLEAARADFVTVCFGALKTNSQPKHPNAGLGETPTRVFLKAYNPKHSFRSKNQKVGLPDFCKASFYAFLALVALTFTSKAEGTSDRFFSLEIGRRDAKNMKNGWYTGCNCLWLQQYTWEGQESSHNNRKPARASHTRDLCVLFYGLGCSDFHLKSERPLRPILQPRNRQKGCKKPEKRLVKWV